MNNNILFNTFFTTGKKLRLSKPLHRTFTLLSGLYVTWTHWNNYVYVSCVQWAPPSESRVHNEERAMLINLVVQQEQQCVFFFLPIQPVSSMHVIIMGTYIIVIIADMKSLFAT